MKGNIVTLTGPSAGGKSFLEKLLVETGQFYKTVSTTTREKREGEVEGEDYFFVDHRTFVNKQRNGDFIESVYFSGNGYAVDRAEIDRAFQADKNVVIVCEPSGAKQIARYCHENQIGILSVFVTNTEEVLLNRFLEREFKSAGLLSADKIRYKADRLMNLIEKEMMWVSIRNWDVIIERFDSSNQAEVVDFLCQKTTEETLSAKAS